MNTDLREVLIFLDPRVLTYEQWLKVGMALKHEGYTAYDWEQWSKRDPERFKNGECFKKWTSFQGAYGDPVTGATLIKLAQEQGYHSSSQGQELEWDAVITRDDDYSMFDPSSVGVQSITEPVEWDPVQQITTYLETLFDASEHVGYVTSTYQQGDRFLPQRGNYDRTAGQLIVELARCNGDIESVFGDANPQAGAWIRFNPLDGQGIKNTNVTSYRYALVESDEMTLERQNAIIRELELPVACLVYSGGKSIHAIVHIDASNYTEYRERVNYLYEICEKNGLVIDTQNRNPSRLSRMPGFMRNGKKQFLIATNIGRRDWFDWHDWIEGINDDLPDPETLADTFYDLPDLAPPLIDGVLRQGHKMLLAGPSKAGKSFALIELCIALAEGLPWLGWDCAQGRVMYINLELDRESALHRFVDVYETLGIEPKNINNIDIWHLRGRSLPMDKLAPKLIRRASKKDYIAVIIDPIYKIITGDENSAEKMAQFCNQFDKVANELGSAVIYCHHHSKGYQGQKRSMDRASGSGVFARDPDALLDLTELEIPEKKLNKLIEESKCDAIVSTILKYLPDYVDGSIKSYEMDNYAVMYRHAEKALDDIQFRECIAKIHEAEEKTIRKTGWRIEGTLREFPRFRPRDVWFDYPIHYVDKSGVLEELMPEYEKAPWQRAMESRKDPEERKEDRSNDLEIAYSSLEMEKEEGEIITMAEIAEEMGVSKRTVQRYMKDHGGFKTINQGVGFPASVVRTGGAL